MRKALVRSFSPFSPGAGPAARAAAFAAALTLGLSAPAAAQKLAFRAVLDGGQQVPPTGSPGKGTGTFVLDRDANTLSFEISFAGLMAPETAAHIHGFCAAGTNCGVQFALPAGNPKVGVWNYPQSVEDDIVNGLTYVNIHTTAFPGGEIRGQILRDPSLVVMSATIDGSQEVPPTPSPAKGVAHVMVDTIAKRLDITLTYDGLTSAESAAHIHGYCGSGSNCGVQFTLPAGTHKTATWFYPAAREADILAGMTYVNVHSSAFPGGEIRGQILPASTNPRTYCTAKVNSRGCTPAIDSSGEPTATGSDNFFVNASNVLNNKNAIFFWSMQPNNIPFLGGRLCLRSPLVRNPVQGTGGNPPPNDCSGAPSFHFSHAYMAAKSLGAGSLLYGQWFYRDPQHPDGTGIGLTDGLQFEILP